MANPPEVYDSIMPEPDDAFWLDQGRKMVEDSSSALQDAAKYMTTCLGVIVAIYVGVLGFGDFAKEMSFGQACLFMLPVLSWLASIFFCMCVLRTGIYTLCLNSPTDIRCKYEVILETKQSNLNWAFGCLSAGLLIAAFLLALCR